MWRQVSNLPSVEKKGREWDGLEARPHGGGGRDRRPWRQDFGELSRAVSNLPIEWSRWEQNICVAETDLNDFVASFVDKARDKDKGICLNTEH